MKLNIFLIFLVFLIITQSSSLNIKKCASDKTDEKSYNNPIKINRKTSIFDALIKFKTSLLQDLFDY